MAPVVAIEFTDLECKVVQAERSGKGRKPSVRTLFTFPLPKNEELEARVAARSQMLKDLMRQHKLSPQRVRVIIPKHYVVSRKVTLPSTVDEELAGMARFEAERHIPFNAERHVVGHHVLSRQAMQGSEVLLAAVDQPVAKEYLDVCLRAGLNVETLDVSTFALHRAFSAARPPVAEGQEENRVEAVVNIGLAATEIVIVQNGQLVYSRSASVGLARLLDDAGEADPEAGFHISRLADIDAMDPELRLNGPQITPVPGMAPPPAASPVVVLPPPPAPADGTAPPLPPSLPPASGMVSGGGTAVAAHAASTTETFLTPLGEPVSVPPVPAGEKETSGEQTAAEAAPAPAAAPRPVASAALQDSALRLLFSNWQLRLLKEVRNTYEFARREFNCPPITHFHVCGEGALIRNLPQLLSANFGVGASVFDPFQGVEVTQKVQGSLAEQRPAHAALVGGVVTDAPNAVQINLLPSSYLEEKSAKRQQQSYMITGILALTALVLAYVWLSGVLQQQDQRLLALRDSNAKMADTVKDLTEKQKRNEIVQKYARDRKGAVEILDTISSDTIFAFVPSNVALKSFEFNKGESVKITGYAMSLPDANRMVQALEKTGYFEEVKVNEGHNRQAFLPRRPRDKAVYEINVEGIFPKPKKTTSRSSSSSKKEEEE